MQRNSYETMFLLLSVAIVTPGRWNRVAGWHTPHTETRRRRCRPSTVWIWTPTNRPTKNCWRSSGWMMTTSWTMPTAGSASRPRYGRSSTNRTHPLQQRSVIARRLRSGIQPRVGHGLEPSTDWFGLYLVRIFTKLCRLDWVEWLWPLFFLHHFDSNRLNLHCD